MLKHSRPRAADTAGPVDGIEGVRIAPFQLHATQGKSWHGRDHGWHLGIADRLVDAAPGLIAPTRRMVVDTSSADSAAAGTKCWEELTAAGGEVMVVKPLGNLTHGRRGLSQPGLKVRWSRSRSIRGCEAVAATTVDPPG